MSLFDRLIAGSVRFLPKPVVRRVADRYVAGEELSDAVRVVTLPEPARVPRDRRRARRVRAGREGGGRERGGLRGPARRDRGEKAGLERVDQAHGVRPRPLDGPRAPQRAHGRRARAEAPELRAHRHGELAVHRPDDRRSTSALRKRGRERRHRAPGVPAADAATTSTRCCPRAGISGCARASTSSPARSRGGSPTW